MRKCWAIERNMAPSNQTFCVGGITSRLWFSLKLPKKSESVLIMSWAKESNTLIDQNIASVTYLFRALSISMVTSTDRAMVIGWRSSKMSQSRFSNSVLFSWHVRW